MCSKLETWNAIVALVEAADVDGRPLHPTLRELWTSVETSRHTVYIELPGRKEGVSSVAGRFSIERLDPEGVTHVGVIMMNLHAIDAASTRSRSARGDEFVPFAELSKEERYAEVLGHELAHAVWSLANEERARLAMELQVEADQVRKLVLETVRKGLGEAGFEEALRQRMEKLNQSLAALEEPARAAEATIWEELRAS